jgi:hypothetical protein
MYCRNVKREREFKGPYIEQVGPCDSAASCTFYPRRPRYCRSFRALINMHRGLRAFRSGCGWKTLLRTGINKC